MSKNNISLKTILILGWGLLSFFIIYNQRLGLDYLQKERISFIKTTDYVFSETGKDKENLQKYRVDKGNGVVLVGFSYPDDFSNILRFQTPQTVKFKFSFHLTKNCKLDSFPKKMEVVIEQNGIVTVLPISRNSSSELNLNVSKEELIKIHAQAEQQANICGAINMTMMRLETTSWIRIIALWGFWITAIGVMLINGNYFLPLFSLIIVITFQKAELLYTPILSWEQHLLFSALSISTVIICSLVISMISRGIWGRILSTIAVVLLLIIVLFVPISVIGFNVLFEGVMSKYDWFAILQTDLREVFEFVSVFAPKDLIIKTVLVVVLLILTIFFSGRNSSWSKFTQWSMVAVSALVILAYVSSSNVLMKSYFAVSEYYHDLTCLEEQISKRKDIINKINANKSSADEIYVVIIGESANRNHFSLYGYPRITTPLLDARFKDNDLIRFEQSYSCGVSTIGALQYALTQATLEKGTPSESPTIMEVLNATNFQTYWIHNGSTSIRSNLVNLIGEQAGYRDHLSSVYGLEDGKLLFEVDKILSAKSTSNKMIFLKTQGSHVDYCQRLPKGEEWVFKDKEFDRWLIPEKYKTTHISAASNCYDGSIKYTDYFINEIITKIQNTGKVGAVIYFSDHGEEIVEGTAHMGKKPTYGVFAIPMVIWFSDNYKKKYKEKYNNTVYNAKKIFINDSIFDSVLGISGVGFNGVDRKNDISSNLFQSGRYIYRGKKTIYDADNYIFHTYQNLQKLKQRKIKFDVFLGPIKHPFHLAWLTGEYQYPNLAISSTYGNEKYMLTSSPSKRRPIALETVFKYLKPQSSQMFFIQVDFPQGVKIDSSKAADNFISFLDKNHLDSTQIIVASAYRAYLDALSKRGVVVSYLLNGRSSVEDQYNYKTITINANGEIAMNDYRLSCPVNLLFSSCSVDNCLDRILTTTDELSKKMKIERVVIPMFNL